MAMARKRSSVGSAATSGELWANPLRLSTGVTGVSGPRLLTGWPGAAGAAGASQAARSRPMPAAVPSLPP
ncbi:MAG: hypothetical protein ACRD0S_04825, partial [Acidimicrobiales bacterium]